MPTESRTTECAMMLLGTRRATSSVACHVNLVDRVETSCKMARNEAGESRGCCGTDNEARLYGNVQQGSYIVEVVTHRNDVTPRCGQFVHGPSMGNGAGDDDRLTRTYTFLIPDDNASPTGGGRFGNASRDNRICVVDNDVIGIESDELTNDDGPHTTCADNSDHWTTNRVTVISATARPANRPASSSPSNPP